MMKKKWLICLFVLCMAVLAPPARGADALFQLPGEEENIAEAAKETGQLICIDPGHQAKGNTGKEPVGPGSKVLKKMVSDGTSGKWSKLSESRLNLMVSLKLRDELEARGYRVIMTRTVQEVNITNIERAEIANKAGADLMVRIHANSSSNASKRGAFTICCTKKNRFYAGKLYKENRRLADLILKYFAKSTGSKTRTVWETDTMTGLNWSKIPAVILEMGYMSNKKEDLLMASETYQKKMVKGIADGIDAWFSR